jgi:energy-converting hydrogenase Eha subunit G
MVGVIWHYWILGFDGECIFIAPQILLPNDKK